MAQWNHTLDIKDIWEIHRDNISDEERGKRIAARIRARFSKRLDVKSEQYDSRLGELVEMFDSVTGWEDDDETKTPLEEFDIRMEELYEWGDDYRVWIKTF
jgi:hypothetical protein